LRGHHGYGVFLNVASFWIEIKEEPVIEGAVRSIWIIDYEGETLRARGHGIEMYRRNFVFAVFGVFRRNFSAIGESLTANVHIQPLCFMTASPLFKPRPVHSQCNQKNCRMAG
jgi:hypothetical protein